MFLSYSTTAFRQIRQIRGKTKKKHPEERLFIYVYRLAMDAKTRKCDGVAGRKYPSLLEDFQTAATSMAHMRHLASTARGLLCFCLMASQDQYPFYPSNPW